MTYQNNDGITTMYRIQIRAQWGNATLRIRYFA